MSEYCEPALRARHQDWGTSLINMVCSSSSAMSTDGESLAESTLCQPEADLQRLEEAVTVLLKDTAREGLRDTPKASAAAHRCHPMPLQPK